MGQDETLIETVTLYDGRSLTPEELGAFIQHQIATHYPKFLDGWVTRRIIATAGLPHSDRGTTVNITFIRHDPKIKNPIYKDKVILGD